MARSNYILGARSTEYTEQTFTNPWILSRSRPRKSEEYMESCTMLW